MIGNGMTYLFFDTESSNCFRGIHKMCEYGEIRTDESFRIDESSRKDVLLHPGPDGKFNLRSKSGDGVTLAHEEEEYFKHKKFPSIYDYLEAALADEETTVFLWSMENDIRTILDNCYRYGLQGINFVCYDVQILFHKYCQDPKEGIVSLTKAMDALGIDMEGLIAHRPDYDAQMTMLVLHGICQKTGKSVDELLAETPEAGCSSIMRYRQMRERTRKKQQKRMEGKRSQKNKEALDQILATEARRLQKGKFRFSLTPKMRARSQFVASLAKKWVGKGHLLCKYPNGDYIVAFDEEDVKMLKQSRKYRRRNIVTKNAFDLL